MWWRRGKGKRTRSERARFGGKEEKKGGKGGEERRRRERKSREETGSLKMFHEKLETIK